MKIKNVKKDVIKTNYGKKGRFYSKEKIDATNSEYRIIFGERSSGKSFSVLYDFLKDYLEHGYEGAYIRRWIEDVRPKTMNRLFLNFECNELNGNLIEKLSNGKWNSYKYKNRNFYLIKRDENGNVISEDYTPFCHTFALSDWEHDKGTEFPNCKKILFDEFLTRTHYLPDEYTLFNQTLATIIRRRGDVIIYMVGNTVSWDSPYFHEMGLKHMKEMKQGDIDVYEFSDILKVAVEYCHDTSAGKESNKYFAFDNPATKMITKGTWQTDIYPHLLEKYEKKDVFFNFFIVYMDEIVQCEVVNVTDHVFIFCHYKTGYIKKYEDVVFKLEIDNNPYHYTNILKPCNELTKMIFKWWSTQPIYYASNEVGETIRNYLLNL